MKIVIIGQGMWGNALHSLLVRSQNDISFWERGTEITHADVIVLAVPTQAIREVLSFVKPTKSLIVVNSSKGIEEGSHKLPYQIAHEILGEIHYFSLMGPSFAQEVIDNMPTLVNLGFCKAQFVETVKGLFQTDYFRVRPIEGVEAIEIAAAFKNIYALLNGISEGLGFGINTRIKIILLAYEEITKLTAGLGYTIPITAASGIMGDLMLTGSSTESRNYAFGKALVTHSVADALQKSKGVVEGWNSLTSVSYFSERIGEPIVLAELVKAMASHAQDKNTMKKLFLEYIKYV